MEEHNALIPIAKEYERYIRIYIFNIHLFIYYSTSIRFTIVCINTQE
jgi:hypothetical protein